MSLLDNIKGLGGNTPGYSGVSTFNPFKLLGIGESLLRYSDGIKIKDYAFYAVLTSERFILIDNSPKGMGAIAKEMPSELIQKADLEHEGTTPILILHVMIEGQVRHMRLIFTGLIERPEDEARAWYATINGHPLETTKEIIDAAQKQRQEKNEDKPHDLAEHDNLDNFKTNAKEEEKRDEDTLPIKSSKPRKQKPQPIVADGIIDAEVEEERLVAAKILQTEPKNVKWNVPPTEDVLAPSPMNKPVQPTYPSPLQVSVQIEKRKVDSRRAVSIHVQKPQLVPLGRSVMEPHGLMISKESGTSSIAYCVMCGSSISAKSRFCRVCGEKQ